ncbi:MAG: amidohydrolase family protein, partial [Gemmatimonadota bacterium]
MRHPFHALGLLHPLRPLLLLLGGSLLLGASAAAQATPQAREHFDLLVTGGRILDGTGNPWFSGDVGVRDGRIVAVGRLSGATADRTVDATGKVVAPGFIDIHSHADDGSRARGGFRDPDARYRAAPNLIMQGITT